MLSKYAFKMCFQNVLSKCDSTQGFRGDSGGIPKDSVWVCRDSMGFRVVETMSFHTSGTSGISLIIILEGDNNSFKDFEFLGFFSYKLWAWRAVMGWEAGSKNLPPMMLV